MLDTDLPPVNVGVGSTGELQDIAAPLGLEGSGYRVQVQSVSPKPGTALLVVAGLAMHALRRRAAR